MSAATPPGSGPGPGQTGPGQTGPDQTGSGPAETRRAAAPVGPHRAGAAGRRGDRHRGHPGPARARAVAVRAGQPGPALVPAGHRLRVRLAGGVRAEPPAAAAGRRRSGQVQLGDGDHLRGERAVDVDTVRRGSAGRGLLLPAVPPPGAGPRGHRVGAGRLGHRIVLRDRDSPGGRRARGRRAGGERGGVPGRRRVRAARDHGDPRAALSQGQGRRQPRDRLGRRAGAADHPQARARSGRPGRVPRATGRHPAPLVPVRRGIRPGGGELAGRLRLPGLRHQGHRRASAVGRAAAGLRGRCGGGQHGGDPGRVPHRGGRPDGGAGGDGHAAGQGAGRGARLPAGQLLDDPARRRSHADLPPAAGPPGPRLPAYRRQTAAVQTDATADRTAPSTADHPR